MKAQNTTRQDLEMALFNTNAKHGYTLRWNREPEAQNKSGTTWAFTIRSDVSGVRGARTSASGRNTVAASWHAHGHFFEELLALNPEAVIRTGSTAFNGKTCRITKEGGNWQDQNIGSQMCPVSFSDTSIF